jgi:hypothetical protein
VSPNRRPEAFPRSGPSRCVSLEGTLAGYRVERSRVNSISGDNLMNGLSDEELRIVMTLAEPLHPTRRSAFLAAVIAEASRHVEVGPGLISRIARTMQKTFAGPMPTTRSVTGVNRSSQAMLKGTDDPACE